VSLCRGGCRGRRFWSKTQNTNKRPFLASLPTVGRSQNLWEFWDPKRTLYSSSMQQAL
jgi:hypothetical protein